MQRFGSKRKQRRARGEKLNVNHLLFVIAFKWNFVKNLTVSDINYIFISGWTLSTSLIFIPYHSLNQIAYIQIDL